MQGFNGKLKSKDNNIVMARGFGGFWNFFFSNKSCSF